MGLVAARCTQCGAAIEVDEAKDAGICKHCGTAFVTEKVIHQYHTNITQNITKNIYGNERPEIAEYLENGEQFLLFKDWENAKEAFMSAVKAAPSDYRGWLGLVRYETQNFTHLTNTAYEEFLKRAYAVANADEKAVIDGLCAPYIERRKRIGVLAEAMKPILEKYNKIKAYYAFFGLSGVFFGPVMVMSGLIVGIVSGIAGMVVLGIVGCVLTVVGILLLILNYFHAKHINKVKLAPYNDEIIQIERQLKERT